MRLIFLLQKEAWFVEKDLAWYRLSESKDVELALTCLALHMVNQQNLIEQPHHAGSASVNQIDEGSLAVTLKSADKKLLDTITVELSKNSLLNVDWQTQLFRDGWIGCDAEVVLDNVGTFYLDAYLPKHPDSKGKMLTILNADLGSSREVWIARDQKSRIPIVENGIKGKTRLNLRCDPEKVDQSTDPRELGFVMLGEESRPVHA